MYTAIRAFILKMLLVEEIDTGLVTLSRILQVMEGTLFLSRAVEVPSWVMLNTSQSITKHQLHVVVRWQDTLGLVTSRLHCKECRKAAV